MKRYRELTFLRNTRDPAFKETLRNATATKYHRVSAFITWHKHTAYTYISHLHKLRYTYTIFTIIISTNTNLFSNRIYLNFTFLSSPSFLNCSLFFSQNSRSIERIINCWIISPSMYSEFRIRPSRPNGGKKDGKMDDCSRFSPIFQFCWIRRATLGSLTQKDATEVRNGGRAAFGRIDKGWLHHLMRLQLDEALKKFVSRTE